MSLVIRLLSSSRKRITLYVCVIAMTKIMKISIRPASWMTLLSYVNVYLEQEAYWIIGAWSMWVCRMSKHFPENLGYISSIKYNFTRYTVSLSAKGSIASNHISG